MRVIIRAASRLDGRLGHGQVERYSTYSTELVLPQRHAACRVYTRGYASMAARSGRRMHCLSSMVEGDDGIFTPTQRDRGWSKLTSEWRFTFYRDCGVQVGVTARLSGGDSLADAFAFNCTIYMMKLCHNALQADRCTSSDESSSGQGKNEGYQPPTL